MKDHSRCADREEQAVVTGILQRCREEAMELLDLTGSRGKGGAWAHSEDTHGLE